MAAAHTVIQSWVALWRSPAGISVRIVERRAGVNPMTELGSRRSRSSETRPEHVPTTGKERH